MGQPDLCRLPQLFDKEGRALSTILSTYRQLARWLEKLQEVQFTVVHHPGRAHANADALSRQPLRHCGKMCPDPSSHAVNVVTT